MAALQYEATRFDIRSRVRRAYAELAAGEAAARTVEEQAILLKQLLDIARKRFEAGAAPQAEVLQARLPLSQTETQRSVAEGRIQQGRFALNGLLGTEPQQEVEVNDSGLFNLSVSVSRSELVPMPDAPLPTVEELVRQAGERRLDLKVAQQQVQVARRQLGLAEATRVPDINLSAGYLFTQFDDDNVPSGGQTNGVFFGVGVNLPVYNQQGELTLAQATIAQSDRQAAAVQAQINNEVRTAYNNLLVLRGNILRYRAQLLPDSKEVVQLAQLSYQVGKTPLANAILAQQADAQIRSGYIDTIVSYQNAWADLERAVGGPLEL